MNRISRCDWLPERATWSYLARSGYGLFPQGKFIMFWCFNQYNKSFIYYFDNLPFHKECLSFDQSCFIIVSQLQEKHLPWGIPEGGAGQGGCILAQQDFVTGYSTSLHLPLWVAYRLDGKVR